MPTVRKTSQEHASSAASSSRRGQRFAEPDDARTGQSAARRDMPAAAFASGTDSSRHGSARAHPASTKAPRAIRARESGSRRAGLHMKVVHVLRDHRAAVERRATIARSRRAPGWACTPRPARDATRTTPRRVTDPGRTPRASPGPRPGTARHNPPLPRKVGTPLAAETPAPVRIVTRDARLSRSRQAPRASRRSRSQHGTYASSRDDSRGATVTVVSVISRIKLPSNRLDLSRMFRLRSRVMNTRRSLMGVALAAFAAAVISVSVHGQAQTPTGVITGVVQGASGPEAGVWVIAETKDLPTNFIKIVVTNDQGRFLLPELPNASYSVWVRGYGLVDSKPQPLKPSTDAGDAARDAGEDAAGSREGLPRRLLAVDARAAGSQHVPRHRSAGERRRRGDAVAEPLDQLAQVRLQLLPSARQPAHAHRSITCSRRSRS